MITISYTVKSEDGRVLFGDGVDTNDFSNLSKGEQAKCVFSFENILSNGNYMVDLSLKITNEESYCDAWLDCTSFTIKNSEINDLHILPKSQFKVR
jgi:hypothetical protein